MDHAAKGVEGMEGMEGDAKEAIRRSREAAIKLVTTIYDDLLLVLEEVEARPLAMTPAPLPDKSDTRRAYSLRELATLLGVSLSTVNRRAKDGTIVTLKLGSRRLVPLEEADRLLNGERAPE